MDSDTIKWLCFTGQLRIIQHGVQNFTVCKQRGSTKSLFGKEVMPEEITALAEDASDEQRTQREAKVQQRNNEIEDIKERNNSVLVPSSVGARHNKLDVYSAPDCLSQDGTGQGPRRTC